MGCATQGAGGDDEDRLRALLSAFDATFFNFDKRNKRASAAKLLSLLRSKDFDLFVLEGTGVAGGVSAILGRLLWKIPYVVSSGDAVAPYLAARYPLFAPIFALYEKMLCALANGFIGWTPYLVGRALTLGAPRAVSIPGWAPSTPDAEVLKRARDAIRKQYNIPDEKVVFGLVGSLNWSTRHENCYGAELVRAALIAKNAICVMVVGGGSGLDRLRSLAGDALGKSIILPGRIPREEVPSYLAAMDVGSIPQSVDGVGNFRYTTKLAEYKISRLPFVTNQIPMSYDLDDGGIWRLPGNSPWDRTFITALAGLMDSLTMGDVSERRLKISTGKEFDKTIQIERTTAFLLDAVSRS